MLAHMLVLGSFSAAFAPAPFPKPDSTKKDVQNLQGEWVRVSCIIASRPMNSPGVAKLVFTGNRGVYSGVTMATNEWQITIDAKKKPKVLDMTGLSGGEKGAIYWGVYRLEGDTLTICGKKGTDARTRPIDFDGAKEGVVLEVFKRGKP